MTSLEVFGRINSRFQTALLFHKENSELFSFLGLEGFHALHEHQYFDEAKNARSVKFYVIENHNRIIFDSNPQPVDQFPKTWAGLTRGSIKIDERAVQTKQSFDNYYTWEHDTLLFLQEQAKALADIGEIADYKFVISLLVDVQEELANVNQMILELEFCNYDPTHIIEMQSEYAQKYGAE